jgi:hypothetical protein
VLHFFDVVVNTAKELFFLEALASATSLVSLFLFEPLGSTTSLVAVLAEVLSSCSLFGLPAWLHSNSYLISILFFMVNFFSRHLHTNIAFIISGIVGEALIDINFTLTLRNNVAKALSMTHICTLLLKETK